MNIKKLFLTFTSAVLFCAASYAEYNSYGIPDSAEIRRTIVNSWFSQNISELRGKNSELRKNQLGQTFQIRMEERVENCAVIVAPQSFLNVDLIQENSKETVKMAVYPEGAPGSFVLFRDKQSGKASKIQWYFNPDAEVYLEFYEKNKKSYVDLIVYSSYAVRAVPLAVNFNQILTASFQDVQRWTKLSLPWYKVNLVTGQYKESLQMVEVIKSALPQIDYAEYACYDENGKLCSILTGKEFMLQDEFGRDYVPEENGRLTLSGAGFAKWIVDGIVSPYLNKGTKISENLVPTLQFSSTGKNGVISQKYNLSYSLDWCRNLAAKALSVRSSRDYTFENGGVDVDKDLFVADYINGQLVNSTGYLKDTGYAVKKIKGIFYVLAVTEPSYFYLGAIKQSSSIKPDEMVFNNCAVFFPYFDDAGHFDCVVFENGQQMTLTDFVLNNENFYVHLERVKSTYYFNPKGTF